MERIQKIQVLLKDLIEKFGLLRKSNEYKPR